MLGVGWLPFAADAAASLPSTIDASVVGAVDSLVLDGGDEDEVPDPVVRLVFVDVVDLEAVRDLPVVPFPLPAVEESKPSASVGS